MEGLEISEVKLGSIDERLDSEYFKKEFLLNEKALSKVETINIETIGLVTDGNHLTIAEQYSDSEGIRYLRGQDISGDFLVESNSVFIPNTEYKKLSRSHIFKNDVLVTIVGANTGNTALVSNPPEKLTANCKLGFVRPNQRKISSHYLHIFLASKFGQLQIQRKIRGGGQTGLILPDFRSLRIAQLSKDFQLKIEDVSKSVYSLIEKSKSLYIDAENILLEELGLSNWQPTIKNNNTKTLRESLLSSGRIDAEYYQPKYDELFNIITNYEKGYTKLSDLIVEYSTGYPFDSDKFVFNDFPLIRISNIKKGRLDMSNAATIPVEDIELSKRDIVKPNDLLLSMSGTIGNCCKVPEGINAIINQRILRFSVKNFDVDVLCLVINSIVCELQLERVGTGGVQTNISGTDIFNMLIPRVNPKIQEAVSKKIKESSQMQAKGYFLLETAKKSVEMAIEENEGKSLDFLNHQTINVNG